MPCFNSTLVQLKIKTLRFPTAERPSFNSTLVQLKIVEDAAEDSLPLKFQFHIGSIKKWSNAIGKAVRKCFNSTLVQLKTFLQSLPRTCPKWFQFHIGSIKKKKIVLRLRTAITFQFHIGSIKNST